MFSEKSSILRAFWGKRTPNCLKYRIDLNYIILEKVLLTTKRFLI